MEEKKIERDNNILWYKDAIIYELHIKAFRDTNGDGIGDFGGLLEKLDYLKDLGVTAIWVLPFYPSPLKDDGYDIADYYSINPAYGDLDQFKLFLKEAHDRDLKVITELVINHTSDHHPWFQRARLAPKGSRHRDYYVWTDDPTQYKDVRIIFQDFEVSNWTWDPAAQQFYWHRFFYHQPDLNYDNPMVQEEVFKIIDYWCGMGVDGFRLDAVPYLFEREGTNGENLEETHDFLKKLRAHVDEYYPGTLLLAEANMWPEDSASYFGEGDECQMNYHFPLMPRMFMALQTEDRYPITDIFEQTPAIPDNCQWAIFLRNHDELTLEMVTDEERDYMYRVYVKDPKARINLGIRHRLAPLMANNRNKIELLNYLLFSLPGTPVIYYGDEIGMGDNFYLGDRDGVRTPMQWSSQRNAGFSETNPHQLYLPVILDPDYHYESVNVEIQSKNTSSLLWWMKRLINKRKQYKAFSHGDLKFIHCENPKILAFVRQHQEEAILVIVNLSRYIQPAELDLQDFRGYVPKEIFSNNKFPSIKDDGNYFFTMGAHACLWYALELAHPNIDRKIALPHVKVKAWADLTHRPMQEYLSEKVLPDYIMKMRWFGGKARIVENFRIVNQASVPLKEHGIIVWLIEVTYQSGLADLYQLPVAFGKDVFAAKLKDGCPQSIICTLTVHGEEGVLYDAIYGFEWQEMIFKNLAASHSLSWKEGALRFTGNDALHLYASTLNQLKPRVLGVEQSNTSIIYDNRFFLKLYRKVDRAVNPDVEISQYLGDTVNFKNVPAFAGKIEWRIGKDMIVLAMMQEMVESNSDAWAYMLDRLDDFNEKVLTESEGTFLPPMEGNLYHPLSYEEVPKEMQQFIEGAVAERVMLLGVRTAEMHLALARETSDPDFKPEPYSLHYQRSLFSGLQTLVRATFQSQQRQLGTLAPEVRQQAEAVLARKGEIMETFRGIYKKKIDVMKIRIHGDFHLGQVLFTGRDFVITDFEGEPARSFGERRLKRSPLRDVAGMIRSFHYAAYGSLFLDNQIRKEDHALLIPYVEQWYHYVSGFFMKAYQETVKGAPFMPAHPEDLKILMTTFLLEKAIYELNYEMNNRPDWLIIPLQGIQEILHDADENRVPAEEPVEADY